MYYILIYVRFPYLSCNTYFLPDCPVSISWLYGHGLYDVHAGALCCTTSISEVEIYQQGAKLIAAGQGLQAPAASMSFHFM